jgi:hypothetical protein
MGPVGLYVGQQNASASSCAFVGVGRQAPNIDHIPYYDPVFTDFGGKRVQTDDVQAGEKGMVSIDLIQTVAAQIELLEGLNLGSSGVHPPGTRGTLMVAEGKCLTVCVVFPLVALKPALYAGRPNGYRYPTAKVMNITKPSHDGAAETAIIRINFEMIELMTFVNGLPSFLLFDEVVAGLPPMS